MEKAEGRFMGIHRVSSPLWREEREKEVLFSKVRKVGRCLRRVIIPLFILFFLGCPGDEECISLKEVEIGGVK